MMQKILLLLITFCNLYVVQSQVVEISANPGTSSTPALGTSNYVANESIYTETEVGATNFTSAGTAMNRMALSVNTVGAVTTFNNVRIYLKNVPLATTTFTSGTYTNAGYTEVFNGSLTFGVTGWNEFALTTPFVRTAGTNLQMLIERTDGAPHSGFVWNTANGNNTSSTINTTRRYNSTAALSAATVLNISAFRQAVRFVRRGNNDANVKVVYTLGKIPLPNGVPHIISANIVNDGLNPITNLNVTLNITGANTFSNTQLIPSLAVNASTTVSFAAFSPTTEGTNIVTVSVPSDDISINNSFTVTQTANKNTWSYAYGSTAAGGVGFNGSTGDFVAKFNTSVATSLSQVTVNFFAGGQPFRIGVWDATGAGGTPGALLWESAILTSTAGVNVLPVSPILAMPVGDFYVGVKQTGTANVSFAFQTETPIRASTFYFTSPSGGTTWTDFAPANSFRFMIEPKLILATDASVSGFNTNFPSASVSCNGTSNPTVVLNNPGSNSIPAGAAILTYKSGGANSNMIVQNSGALIISGGTQTITFTGANFPNAGVTFDTVFVAYPGDLDKSNDTIKTSHSIAPTITTFPSVEDVETTLPVIPWVSIVSGTRQLWTIQTGNYTNADQTNPLPPHGGTDFFLFDSYSGATSAGFNSRLYSNCLTIPPAGGTNCNYSLSFWMSHDNTTTLAAELDSMYVSVSTDKGATWTRFTGVTERYQRHDGTLTANAAPIWRKETIDLSAYAGQTIQIGFEGVSKYGNAFGLDDITIGSSAANNVALSLAASNGVNLVKTCDDQGWTYYNDPADATKTLIAIQWDPGNTGANAAAKAAAIPKLQLDAGHFAAEDIPNVMATYTMKRYWDLDLAGNPLTAPVNLRFFNDTAEQNVIKNLAQSFATANGGTVEPSIWFKTNSGAFVPNATNVTADKVQNAIALANVNTANARINGVLYTQFNGISSFSGGTFATGVGPNIGFCPLQNTSYVSNLSGTTYQWQVDDGTGFINVVNGAVYGGATTNTLTLTAPPTSYNTNKYRCVVDGTNFSNLFTYRVGVNWTGAVNTDWNNTGNWSCGVLPDQYTDVYILHPLPNFPVVGTNVTIRSIKVNPAASVTVSTGFTITLTGK